MGAVRFPAGWVSVTALPCRKLALRASVLSFKRDCFVDGSGQAGARERQWELQVFPQPMATSQQEK